MDTNEDPGARMTAGPAALIGVLALSAALAAGHLAAALVGPGASPYLAVGNGVIDLSPEWLTDFAKDAFGTANKLVLLLGMAVVLLVLAIGAGLAARTRPRNALVVIALLGIVGVVAVLTRPDLGQLAVLAPVASGVVGLVVFRWLHGLALARARDSHRRNPGLAPSNPGLAPSSPGLAPRRRFLVGSVGVAVGAGIAGAGGQWLAGPDAEASRRAVGALMPVRRAPAIPAGADFAAEGTPTLITANRDFYTIHTALVVPRVRAQDWSLRVHGMVSRPMTLSYDDLRRRTLVERTLTLACVSNPVGGDLISTANFVGVDLAELLAEAGVEDGAEQLFSTSVDGFTAGTPMDVVLERDRGAMLALAMNGEPLPLKHGFPVRMVVPGLYGFVSATKWLTDLEVTTWDARTPYWLPRGWAREAPVKTQSRIDSPSAGATVNAGMVVVAGTAWAPHIGIEAVEVRVDDGPWRGAELAEEVSIDTWRMWRAEVRVRPGEHRLTCRATDRRGETQTAATAPVAPDGATGRHQVLLTAR